MILFLRAFFIVVLASMLAVTSWASWHCPLFAIPADVATHPWFIATLFDAYWGFLTFFVWVAFKETAWAARVAWLVAILLLGNLAMAAYCLRELFSAGPHNRVSDILVSRHLRVGWLAPAMAAIGIVVIGVGWRTS